MDLSALPWKDLLTISAAMVGAVLGIMNTWNSISARRVRVLIKPALAIPYGGDPNHGPGFSIEVVNLSAFPITVAEIGFTLRQNRRMPIPSPTVLDYRQALPKRLESREAETFYFNPHPWIVSGARIEKAYARLASGEIETGTSPIMKQLRDSIAQG